MAYTMMSYGHTPIDKNDTSWHLVRYWVNEDGAICGMGNTVERGFESEQDVIDRARELYPYGCGDAGNVYQGRVVYGMMGSLTYCYCARPAIAEISSARTQELQTRLEVLKAGACKHEVEL